MKYLSFLVLLFTVAVAALGCREQSLAPLIPGIFPGERRSVPEGTLSFDPPTPLEAISTRPADLLMLERDQVDSRVTVSGDNYPNGRKDLPWLAGAYIDPPGEGEFNPLATPYWSAPLPAWVEVDLGDLSYVSQVVVEPYSVLLGASEISVHLISPDGAEVPVAQNVQLPAEAVGPRAVQRPPAIAAAFPPRIAKRVKILFSKAGASEDANIYVRSMRVLGAPASGPYVAPPADIAEPLQKALGASRSDLAAFPPETAQAQIAATGELIPGSAFLPWLAQPQVDDQFWAAAEPAAVTVDLGKVCYIDQVVVSPLDERFGARRFYVKILTPDGRQLDTVPPANVPGPDVAPPGTGFRPQPLAAAFDPVLAQKLRFYFPDGGYANDFVYVQRIQVLGIPASE